MLGDRGHNFELLAKWAQMPTGRGAIGSPQILQLSGLGPKAVLEAAGVEQISELAVGENLQDHLQIRCAYKVEGVETLNERANSLLGKAGIGLQYLLFYLIYYYLIDRIYE